VILLIDNYDSFVYNLARYLQELGCETRVVRNDAVTLQEIERMTPQGIVLSPGPCTPREAGLSIDVVRQFGSSVPILGVCLGHQAIGMALGGEVIRAPQPVHGMLSLVKHDGSRLFEGVPNPFRAGRYHSLIVDEGTLPADLKVTARTQEEGLVMALEHHCWPLFGVQFHPESVLTFEGRRILSNFVGICGLPIRLQSSEEIPPPADSADETAGCAVDPRPMFW